MWNSFTTFNVSFSLCWTFILFPYYFFFFKDDSFKRMIIYFRLFSLQVTFSMLEIYNEQVIVCFLSHTPEKLRSFISIRGAPHLPQRRSQNSLVWLWPAPRSLSNCTACPFISTHCASATLCRSSFLGHVTSCSCPSPALIGTIELQDPAQMSAL